MKTKPTAERAQYLNDKITRTGGHKAVARELQAYLRITGDTCPRTLADVPHRWRKRIASAAARISQYTGRAGQAHEFNALMRP